MENLQYVNPITKANFKNQTIDILGSVYQFKIKSRRNDSSEIRLKTRVYVTRPDISILTGISAPDYSIQGEDPLSDILWKKFNEMEISLEAYILENILPDRVLKFSRKAGCSCGCSPGWIDQNEYGRTVWVSVEITEQNLQSRLS